MQGYNLYSSTKRIWQFCTFIQGWLYAGGPSLVVARVVAADLLQNWWSGVYIGMIHQPTEGGAFLTGHSIHSEAQCPAFYSLRSTQCRAFYSLRGTVQGFINPSVAQCRAYHSLRSTVQGLLFTQRHSARPFIHSEAQCRAYRSLKALCREFHSRRGSVQFLPFTQRLSTGPSIHSEVECFAYQSQRFIAGQGLPFTQRLSEGLPFTQGAQCRAYPSLKGRVQHLHIYQAIHYRPGAYSSHSDARCSAYHSLRGRV